MNLVSLSHGGDGNQDRQEVPKCPDDDDYDWEEDEESSSEANKQKEEDEDDTVRSERCASASESSPPTIVKEMEEIFLRQGFS